MLHALLAFALLLPAAPEKARRAGHPDVGAGNDADACQSCHAEATPEVVKRWEGGKHGLVLVKCFVCHGSAGKDFTARPGNRRCEGCHPAALAAVAPARKGGAKTCSDCHVPHSLAAREGARNPHAGP
jgi:hypothetical protein